MSFSNNHGQTLHNFQITCYRLLLPCCYSVVTYDEKRTMRYDYIVLPDTAGITW